MEPKYKFGNNVLILDGDYGPGFSRYTEKVGVVGIVTSSWYAYNTYYYSVIFEDGEKLSFPEHELRLVT